MNIFEKIATFLFRLIGLFGVGVCIHGAGSIARWGLPEWLILVEAILLVVFGDRLGRLVGRDLG
jgi:hypothetical protein